jgi:hypothetical protein
MMLLSDSLRCKYCGWLKAPPERAAESSWSTCGHKQFDQQQQQQQQKLDNQQQNHSLITASTPYTRLAALTC